MRATTGPSFCTGSSAPEVPRLLQALHPARDKVTTAAAARNEYAKFMWISE
jgi:hypothetical protein